MLAVRLDDNLVMIVGAFNEHIPESSLQRGVLVQFRLLDKRYLH